MKVVVIEPPSPVVTLEEAKRHLVVDADNTDDDLLIATFIAAATTWLDGATGWLGRALGVQVLELQLNELPCDSDPLPFPPLIEVLSIKYVDPSGVEHELPYPWFSQNLPEARGRDGDVRIRYRAGYGKSSGEPVTWINAVPPPIKVAILMLVAQWYSTRAPIAVGASVEALPFAVEALLSPYRVYR
jgi:uncharacterized phiE125 gp8 family phage protein